LLTWLQKFFLHPLLFDLLALFLDTNDLRDVSAFEYDQFIFHRIGGLCQILLLSKCLAIVLVLYMLHDIVENDNRFVYLVIIIVLIG
jgi:hypothetical protein